MDIRLLNTDRIIIAIIDRFESLIWVDRTHTFGDFELKLPFDADTYFMLREDYYLEIDDSQSTMIIETSQIQTDAESGNYILVSGRCLKSILKRRVVWGITNISGSVQTAMKNMITASIINPALPERKINNFLFQDNPGLYVDDTSVEAQYDGDELYEVISGLCDLCGLCFDVVFTETNQLVFFIYKGVDRSYDQTMNPYVVFSPNFDNLLNSNYITSNQNTKNVAMIIGEGEGADRKTLIQGTASGLNRREIFVDASYLTSYVSETETLTPAQYLELMRTSGNEILGENLHVTAFEGETDPSNMFKYGEHYSLGDIVQIENEYGLTAKSKVAEVMISEDSSGKLIIPVFSAIE